METKRTSNDSETKSRLANAYSIMDTYSNHGLSFGDNRMGGTVSYINPLGERYTGVYVDNVVNPNKGLYDGSINLPVGRLDYGYDDGTVYAGYSNPYTTGSYSNANGSGAYIDKNGQNVAEAYRQNWGDGNTAYGGAINTGLNIPNSYNEINLPTGGMIGYGSQDGRVQADYTPAQDSIVARLLNALTGK